MPNCFQLFRIGVEGGQPIPLNTVVDVEIANHMGVEVHPKHWCYDWYHCIGFLIACKDDCALGSQRLRDEVIKWTEDRAEYRAIMLKVLAFMEANYSSNAWVRIGK